MPYITASIIMQVLGVVIPKLEELQQQGAVGQRKITQYTRYLAIAIATLQATGLTFIFGTGPRQAFFGAQQRARPCRCSRTGCGRAATSSSSRSSPGPPC